MQAGILRVRGEDGFPFIYLQRASTAEIVARLVDQDGILVGALDGATVGVHF